MGRVIFFVQELESWKLVANQI